jgi:hypothetical protein
MKNEWSQGIRRAIWLKYAIFVRFRKEPRIRRKKPMKINKSKTALCGALLNSKILPTLGVLALSLAIIPEARAGSFILTSSMGTAETSPATVLLQNGNVLVVGNSDSELYSYSGGWTDAGNSGLLPFAVAGTILQNGKALFCGGQSGETWSAGARLYDPASGWSFTPGMNFARADHTLTLLPNGTALAVGGLTADAFGENFRVLSNAEFYVYSSGSWTVAANSMKSPRLFHTATVLQDGTLLVAGGASTVSGGGTLSTAEIYNPASQTWTLTTHAMNYARSGHTATLLADGTVLVAGGDNNNPSTAEIYNPTSQTWTLTGPMNASRAFHTATLLPNGKVLVAGGENLSAITLQTAEIYDPVSKTWTQTSTPMNYARWRQAAALLPNGLVLIAGGDSTGKTAELYDSSQVLNFQDSGPGSLRAMIAGASSGDTITFNIPPIIPGTLTSGTIDLASELLITNNLTIVGQGADVDIISGSGTSSVFHITNGVVNISGLTMWDGKNQVGGGVYSQYATSTVNLYDCTIEYNASTIYGGAGIWNEGTMSIVGCTVANNVTLGLGAGAGIYNNFGTLRVTNSTIALNDATFLGGGGIFNAGQLTLASCTIASNSIAASGDLGGGIYNDVGTINIQNSIVARNTTLSTQSPDVSGAFASAGYNLIGIASGSTGWGSSGDQTGTMVSPINPKLDAWQDNGGPTFTMGLLKGSPAIDQGKSFGLTTDQRNSPRPYDNPGIPNAIGGDGSDIGAFELYPPLLSISRSGNQAIASWPSAINWTLQTNGDLVKGVWANYGGTIGDNGTIKSVTFLPPPANLFFRLAQ